MLRWFERFSILARGDPQQIEMAPCTYASILDSQIASDCHTAIRLRL